jgi:hypothetical protein
MGIVVLTHTPYCTIYSIYRNTKSFEYCLIVLKKIGYGILECWTLLVSGHHLNTALCYCCSNQLVQSKIKIQGIRPFFFSLSPDVYIQRLDWLVANPGLWSSRPETSDVSCLCKYCPVQHQNNEHLMNVV